MAANREKKRVPVADPNFAHLLPGPSNEELAAKQEAADAEYAARGYQPVTVRARNPQAEERDADFKRKAEANPDLAAPFSQETYDRRSDGFEDLEFDPLGLSDPLYALKRQYEREGFALKLLSDKCCGHLGRRNYDIVKDANGEPVRCGNMVLGEIPQRLAEARRRAPIREAKAELGSIKDAQRAAVEQLKTDAKDMGLTVMEPGETLTSNAGRGPRGQSYDMGLTIERGEAPGLRA